MDTLIPTSIAPRSTLSGSRGTRLPLGLASAIGYLHKEWEQCLVHRNVDHDFMLDLAFNANLSVFGLARLVDHEHDMQTTALVGTRGYMALNTPSPARPTKSWMSTASES